MSGSPGNIPWRAALVCRELPGEPLVAVASVRSGFGEDSMLRSYAKASTLPGPRRMPLLGTKGNFIRFMRDPTQFMDRLRRGYGKIVSLGRGTTDYVFVFGPEYNREVLNNISLFHNLD